MAQTRRRCPKASLRTKRICKAGLLPASVRLSALGRTLMDSARPTDSDVGGVTVQAHETDVDAVRPGVIASVRRLCRFDQRDQPTGNLALTHDDMIDAKPLQVRDFLI